MIAVVVAAAAAFAMANARPAEAYTDFFCPEGGLKWYSSGQTCGFGEYHHIDTVAFTVSDNNPQRRHCANLSYGSNDT
ncbi:MAG TPA: hypothetical protein VF545_06690, partial [Thermoleophilaceae bacterium]